MTTVAETLALEDLALTVQPMIDECLWRSSELLKHSHDAWFVRFACTFAQVSGGVSARQPRLSVKILTDRG